MPLTDTAIRTAKAGDKPAKLFDSGGLFLLLNPTGSRLWRLKYRINGREKLLALGSYPEVSLKQAREQRDVARKQLAADVDPSVQRQADKAARIDTFRAVADEFLELKAKKQAPVTVTKARWLLGLLHPRIGSRPIGKISASELLKALKKIEARGNHETAHRAKQKAGEVFRYGISTDRCEHDVSASLRGALAPVITTSRAAIVAPVELGALLRAVDGYQGQPTTATALKLLPLVFVRPGELRKAEWVEFDLDGGEWNIPASKMKMKQPHIVPLSKQAVAVLRELHSLTGSGKYLFPAMGNKSRPMSDNTLNAALRRLGFDTKKEASAHGFRATARTMLDEVLHCRVDLIEHQLAHEVKDTNGRAYNRTSHLPERRKMMQTWSDYLDGLRTGAKVIPIKRGT